MRLLCFSENVSACFSLATAYGLAPTRPFLRGAHCHGLNLLSLIAEVMPHVGIQGRVCTGRLGPRFDQGDAFVQCALDLTLRSGSHAIVVLRQCGPSINIATQPVMTAREAGSLSSPVQGHLPARMRTGQVRAKCLWRPGGKSNKRCNFSG
jgi:hypothetical protein